MGKLLELEAALESLVRPGMAIHLTTQARAATRALQRVFQGQDLGLTLIMGRIGGGNGADLLASGLVRHVIAGSYGAVSRQYTGRLAQVQQVYESGEVSFQHWTFFTLMQRLIAAAQGMPFALTHSLFGSGMAADNGDDFQTLDDPFGSGQKINLIRALHPDLAILHAQAADEQGNAIMLPPLEEGAWGAKAARKGVLVTAEHIVGSDYIRKHSHLVQLPGRYVTAVAHVPYGAHPGAFASPILPELRSYDEDEEFYRDYFAAVRDPQRLARWVSQWITAPENHAAYLKNLGSERLEKLCTLTQAEKGHVANEVAYEVTDKVAAVTLTDGNEACSDNELLMTLALRHVLRRTAVHSYDVFLVGAGLSEVPGTAAHLLLEEQGIHVDLVMGHGYYGFRPVPGRSDPDPSTSMMTTDAPAIYGTVLGGRRGAALAILGAAQVDRQGNLNSTLVKGVIITGSGGSNDAASTCDTLVVTRLSRRKLLDRVDYITCAGTSVQAVVTERGIFEKSPEGDLILTSYIDPEGIGREAVLEQIRQGCGWDLRTGADVREEILPAATELGIIRRLMPSRYG